ncbi:hypothetical protein LXA43DRAFT_1068198 [Ganoderma leucocontextum]|nr:hypothetical protein LXA43DRAFT_1068198 [Ganoderma leucocontextum]
MAAVTGGGRNFPAAYTNAFKITQTPSAKRTATARVKTGRGRGGELTQESPGHWAREPAEGRGREMRAFSPVSPIPAAHALMPPVLDAPSCYLAERDSGGGSETVGGASETAGQGKQDSSEQDDGGARETGKTARGRGRAQGDERDGRAGETGESTGEIGQGEGEGETRCGRGRRETGEDNRRGRRETGKGDGRGRQEPGEDDGRGRRERTTEEGDGRRRRERERRDGRGRQETGEGDERRESGGECGGKRDGGASATRGGRARETAAGSSTVEPLGSRVDAEEKAGGGRGGWIERPRVITTWGQKGSPSRARWKGRWREWRGRFCRLRLTNRQNCQASRWCKGGGCGGCRRNLYGVYELGWWVGRRKGEDEHLRSSSPRGPRGHSPGASSCVSCGGSMVETLASGGGWMWREAAAEDSGGGMGQDKSVH